MRNDDDNDEEEGEEKTPNYSISSYEDWNMEVWVV